MRIAPHTFILATVLTLASCSPSAEAPAPELAEATPASSATAPSEKNENARLDE